ncbi:MAG: SDR family NAD(P)-dependent oxidoreductase, partial [Altererythrobacter sp.]|nr:SDR family NAD(P)-dependent oxidoreductase [Altererythrobacter sp.]
MNLFDLSGKTAVITGGNSGIGLAFARGLVKSGADVAIWARNEAKNAAAMAELNALGGGSAAAFPCDVAKEEQ